MREETEQPGQFEELAETPTLPRVESVAPIGSERRSRRLVAAPLGAGLALLLVLISVLLIEAHGRSSTSIALHAATWTPEVQSTATTSAIISSTPIAGPTSTSVATATSTPAPLPPTGTAIASQRTATPTPTYTVATTYISVTGFANIGASLTQTSDGNLWFTAQAQNARNAIVRMTPQGATAAFWMPQGVARNIYTLTRGPDDAIWFYEDNLLAGGTPKPTNWTYMQYIASMTKQGTITEYQIPPQGTANVTLRGGMLAGPDGQIWFGLAVNNAVKLVKVSLQGAFTFYSLPGGGIEYNLVVGSDNAIWAHEANVPAMLRVTTDGQISEWPIQSANGQGMPYAMNLTVGADGAIWMSDGGSGIGPYMLKGNVKLYQLTNFGIYANVVSGEPMTRGKDGKIWFGGQLNVGQKNGITTYTVNLGSIALNGAYSLYEIPLLSSNPNIGVQLDTLIAGSDGYLWGIDAAHMTIVKVTY